MKIPWFALAIVAFCGCIGFYNGGDRGAALGMAIGIGIVVGLSFLFAGE